MTGGAASSQFGVDDRGREGTAAPSSPGGELADLSRLPAPKSPARWLRYAQTVIHLQPTQIARLLLKRVLLRSLHRRLPTAERTPVLRGTWAPRAEFLDDPCAVSFDPETRRVQVINIERTLGTPVDWAPREMPLLWQLELNYFHWMPGRLPWAQARPWVADWLEYAPKDVRSQCWNPFGVAQRVLRWTRLIRGPWWDDLQTDPLFPVLLRSLYAQCRFLAQHQEKELLGNHLLKTACALYAGARFFAGSEADGWLRTATAILEVELEAQILADGGHYERSPMYHLMVMVDLIDAYNITPAGDRFAQVLRPFLEATYRFATVCAHGDGEIPLFNDSVIAQAPPRPAVLGYAEQVCGLTPAATGTPGFVALPQFGLFRLGDRRTALWLDAGATGPPFLQAHAHADTGSFELSVDHLRIVCDRGVYSYQDRNHRTFDRSTPAHSTVTVAGESSSDCWGSFRVARRARIRALEWSAEAETQAVMLRHDGFRHLPGAPVHQRRVDFNVALGGYTICDRIEGRRDFPLRCDSLLYLGPGVRGLPVVAGTEPDREWSFELGHQDRPELSLRVSVSVTGAREAAVFLEPAAFAPSFHTEQPGFRLRAACLAELDTVEIRWAIDRVRLGSDEPAFDVESPEGMEIVRG